MVLSSSRKEVPRWLNEEIPETKRAAVGFYISSECFDYYGVYFFYGRSDLRVLFFGSRPAPSERANTKWRVLCNLFQLSTAGGDENEWIGNETGREIEREGEDGGHSSST